jgi:hypothetical protein
MAEVVRQSSQEIHISFDRDEASVLRELVGQLEAVIRNEERDEVSDRLFPAAYEDDEKEKSYRSLVHDDLKVLKLNGLDEIMSTLGRSGRAYATIPLDKGELWVAALTDIRLALGIRLEVDEDKMNRELDPDDPEAPTLSVLHWLGWLQEAFLEALVTDEDDFNKGERG